MKSEESYLVALLIESKEQLKMVEFLFRNNLNMNQKQINAVLDEKLRLEKRITDIEKILKELKSKK